MEVTETDFDDWVSLGDAASEALDKLGARREKIAGACNLVAIEKGPLRRWGAEEKAMKEALTTATHRARHDRAGQRALRRSK